MKLHVVVGSTNCRKALAVAHHLGIPLELEYLDVFTGDLENARFLALNPNGMVPTLEDDGFVLWESNAIMQYFCDQVDQQRLLPSDPRMRAGVVRWQSWELAHYNQAMATLVYETLLKPQLFQQPGEEKLIATAKEKLAQHARVLEHCLADRDYLVGDELTLADYSVAHFEPFHQALPFDWTPYPRIRAYYARMGANPHWQASAPTAEQAIGRRPAVA